MNSTNNYLSIGTFVKVGDSIGVVVGWPNTNGIPDDHYAIWYGQVGDNNLPQCRTVPVEYCDPCSDIQYYH